MSRLFSAHLEAKLGPKPVGVPTNNQGGGTRIGTYSPHRLDSQSVALKE